MKNLRSFIVLIALVLIVPVIALFDGDTDVATPANDSYLNGTAAVTITFPGIADITLQYSNDNGSTYAPLFDDFAVASPYTYNWSTNNGSFPDGLNYSLMVNVTNTSNVLDTVGFYLTNLTIDNLGPNVTINEPQANTRLKDGSSFALNISVDDATSGLEDGATCLILIDGAEGKVNGTLSYDAATGECAGTLLIANPSNLSDGTRQLRVNVTDKAGNMNTSAVRNIIIDNAGPQVTSFSANASAVTSANADIQLTVNVTDSGSLVNVSVVRGSTYVNMSPAGGNLFQLNTTPSTFGCSSDGACTLNITAIDDLGNENTTTTLTITVDSATPAVNLISLNTTNVSAAASLRIRANVTDLSGLVNVSLSNADGSGAYLNMSPVGGNLFERNTTATALGCTTDGSCTINVTAIDALGNINNTLQYTFVVDNLGPNITIVSPSASTRVKDGSTFLLNVTVNDTGSGVMSGTTCLVLIDGDSSKVNGSLTYDLSTSICSGTMMIASPSNLSDGTRQLTVNITDYAGNTNESAPVSLIIDNARPAVTSFISNASNVTTSTSIELTVNVTDSGSLVNVSVVRGSTYVNMSPAGGNLFQLNTTPSTFGCSSDGACTLNITAIDDLGNENTTTTLTLTLDGGNPSVTSISANNTYVTDTASIRFSVNVTDSSGLANVSLTGASVHLNMSPAGGNLFERNTTASALGCAADGICTINITAIDSLGNVNATEQYSFTVDSTPPSLSVVSPVNNSNSSASPVLVNVSASDVLSGNVNVSLYVNGSYNASARGNGTFLFNISAADGFYSWYVVVSDNASSTNTSDTFVFRIDGAGPTVSGVSFNVTGNITSSTATVQMNVTVSDVLAIANVTVGNSSNVSMASLGAGMYQYNATPSSLGCGSGSSCLLTFTALDALGNSGTTTATLSLDGVNPSVTSVTLNNTYVTDSASIRVRVNVTDSNGINNVSVTKSDGAGAYLNMSPAGGNLFERNTTASELGCTSNGLCTLNISAIDVHGNRNMTEQYSFTVDSTPPSLSVVSPVNNSNSSASPVLVNVSASDVLSGNVNVSLYVNGSYNASARGNGTFLFNISAADGFYSWYVVVSDNASSTNTSDTFVFRIDSSGPTLSAVRFNVSGNLTLNTSTVMMNVTVADALSIANVTVANSSNASMASIGGGVYQYNGTPASLGCTTESTCALRFAAVDALGNWGETTATLILSTSAPQITLNAPANASNTTSTSVVFNWTANSTAAANLSCSLYVAGAAVYNTTGNGTMNSTHTLSQGTTSWYVSCTDGVLSTTSATRQVVVDSLAPTVTLVTPNSTQADSYFGFRIDVNESNPNTTLVLYNLSMNGTTVSSGSLENSSFTLSGTNSSFENASFFSFIGNGDYNLTLVLSDLYGNSATTRTNFTVNDTTMPNVTSTSPSGELSSSTTSVSLNATTNENATCSYDTSDVAFVNMSANFTGEGLLHNSTVSVSSGASYTYYVRCTDAAGNVMNTSSSLLFSVAAEETSSSSSGRRGGGGGGGGSAMATTVGSSPVQKVVSLTGRVDFRIPGDTKTTHTMRVKSINGDTATIIIQSDPIEVTLKKGESKDVDVDGDGKNDIRVTLNTMSANSVSVSISTPVAAAPAEQQQKAAPVTTTQAEEESSEVPEAPQTPTESVPQETAAPQAAPAEAAVSDESTGTYWPLIAILVAAAIGLVAYVMQKRSH